MSVCVLCFNSYELEKSICVNVGGKMACGVATVSRINKIIGLFCKRDL